MANMKDPYAAQCAWSMQVLFNSLPDNLQVYLRQGLRNQFHKNIWADPYEFFTDGPLLNLGSDFALMPSLFEPSGVVQQAI
jgi:glycogen synthase